MCNWGRVVEEGVVAEELSVYERNMTSWLKQKEAWVRPVSLAFDIWLRGVGQCHTLAVEFY